MATKIKCASFDCKYCSVNGNCLQKSIRLADSYVHTKHGGFEHFNICKNYEKDEEIEKIQKDIKEWFSNGNEN